MWSRPGATCPSEREMSMTTEDPNVGPAAASPVPLPPPAHRGPLPPPRVGEDGVAVVAGAAYAGIPGIRPLELDLWLPPDAYPPVPAVVFLHGGGWRMGSRASAGPAFARG